MDTLVYEADGSLTGVIRQSSDGSKIAIVADSGPLWDKYVADAGIPSKTGIPTNWTTDFPDNKILAQIQAFPKWSKMSSDQQDQFVEIVKQLMIRVLKTQ